MQNAIPEFGPAADIAVKAACAEFPGTFRLRGHNGTFRVSVRSSYVSGGKVIVYTQRLHTQDSFTRAYGRNPRTSDELWQDFAKGTPSELRSQIVR